MRAVAVSAYGATPALTEVPTPQPGPGQILIKIRAAGMNPMDRSIANGAWKATMPGTFPLVLGADVAGTVEEVGQGVTRFSRGDEVFGQLIVPPLGSTGTYAEYVAVTENAPLARVPRGLDAVVAAALPTIGVTALDLADSLQPLGGKTVLVVGAGGGVGSFFTQFAAQTGASVIAGVRASVADRLRSYGAAETVDYTEAPLADAVHRAHPDGIGVLVDLASDAEAFRPLAALVRRGGTAVTTRYVADVKALAAAGVNGVNYRLHMSPELLQQVAESVAAGRIVPPPITRVTLDDVPRVFSGGGTGDGKMVVVL